MISGSNLFIKNLNPTGNENCYYCGNQCESKKENSAKLCVKDAFTNRDIVQFPHSQYVCDGCVAVMNENAEIELVTGEKIVSRNRIYSWVITKEKNIAYSKSHIQLLREKILNPPEPPFVIVIATSGQKQLLFRSVVANENDNFPLMFEDSHFVVNIEELKKAIDVATNVCASLGKISLKGECDYSMGIRYFESYGNLDLFRYWFDNNTNEMFQLASYLCEPKEFCLAKMKGIINEKIK